MWMLDSGPRDYSSYPLNQGPISPVTPPILFLSSNLVTLKDTYLGGQGRSAHFSLTNQESSNNCILEPVTNGILRGILPKHLPSDEKAVSWKTLYSIPTRKVSCGRKTDANEQHSRDTRQLVSCVTLLLR